MRPTVFVFGCLLAGCGNKMRTEATLVVEDESGEEIATKIVDDTFHLNGFVNILDDDTSSMIELQLAQLQPGPYQTELRAVMDNGVEIWGPVVLNVDVKWRKSGRFPFHHDVAFTSGEIDGYTIVDGGFKIYQEGCRSAGGQGASLECGAVYTYEEEPDTEVDIALSGPEASKTLTAGVCPDDLVEQWLDGTDIVMTGKKLDLGASMIDCVTTQAESRACGDSATGIKADGCDDWQVAVFGYPNATSGNPPFTFIIAAGAECGGEQRACRSTWYSDSLNPR